MKATSPIMKTMPLDIVGSTAFGRYPKISLEQTFNMIISDDWFVPYAGYKNVAAMQESGQGRGLYSSDRFQHMIAVVNNGVYTVNENLAVNRIGNIETFNGDVFIDENNAGQIAICDKTSIHIFDYLNNSFTKATLDVDFVPGYICFQDGYFIAPNLRTIASNGSAQSQWRLSDLNNGLSWPAGSPNVGPFQTKPDRPLATVRLPGKGNLLFVFGGTVTESWTDTGQQLFPYQKNTYMNIDYGCLNPATIAVSDRFIIWLGVNEKSGAVIMFSDGGAPQQISNDGINFRLAQLTNPENSYGFLFKQDGHLIYQFTFPDDNLSMAYDFNTQKFFTLTDTEMNYHIAKRVVYFNNAYYFVSFNDGNLYEMSTKYTTFDNREIPRIRVCKNKRLPDASRMIISNLTFTLEQGQGVLGSAIDFSMSKDGGQSFGSVYRKELNTIGHRLNQFNLWNLGSANDFITQFRFWGFDRFVVNDGVMSYYQ